MTDELGWANAAQATFLRICIRGYLVHDRVGRSLSARLSDRSLTPTAPTFNSLSSVESATTIPTPANSSDAPTLRKTPRTFFCSGESPNRPITTTLRRGNKRKVAGVGVGRVAILATLIAVVGVGSTAAAFAAATAAAATTACERVAHLIILHELFGVRSELQVDDPSLYPPLGGRRHFRRQRQRQREHGCGKHANRHGV